MKEQVGLDLKHLQHNAIPAISKMPQFIYYVLLTIAVHYLHGDRGAAACD